MEVDIRQARPDDIEFLWTALFYASHSDDQGRTVDDIRVEPTLRRYLADWGRTGDLGVVADIASIDTGAAWLRLFVPGDAADPTFVDDETPELAIAVLPKYQGLGVGTTMLEHLIEEARGTYPGVVLSVRAGNPVVSLYRRLGFREVARITNRVGTESLKMLLDF